MIEGFPQPIAPMSSSSGFLGASLPFSASSIEGFVTHIEEYLSSAVEEALTATQERLRLVLSSYPEWAPFKDQVTVEWDGDGFQYVFTGTDTEIQEMRNLEYGFDVDASPKTATRKTAFEMEDRAGKLISDLLNRELGLA